MTHEVHGQGGYPHGGHKMPMPHGNHNRHAGHSVAMFRYKFWLTFSLSIPVVESHLTFIPLLKPLDFGFASLRLAGPFASRALFRAHRRLARSW